MSKLLQRYQQQIIERPIRTYAIQAGKDEGIPCRNAKTHTM